MEEGFEELALWLRVEGTERVKEEPAAHLMNPLKQLINRQRYNSRLLLIPHHGMRLPARRLPIRKHRPIKPPQCGPHHRTDLAVVERDGRRGRDVQEVEVEGVFVGFVV